MMSQDTLCKHDFTVNTTSAFQSVPWPVQVLLSQIGLGLVNSFLTWEGGEEGWLDGVPRASNPPSYLESN